MPRRRRAEDEALIARRPKWTPHLTPTAADMRDAKRKPVKIITEECRKRETGGGRCTGQHHAQFLGRPRVQPRRLVGLPVNRLLDGT